MPLLWQNCEKATEGGMACRKEARLNPVCPLQPLYEGFTDRTTKLPALPAKQLLY